MDHALWDCGEEKRNAGKEMGHELERKQVVSSDSISFFREIETGRKVEEIVLGVGELGNGENVKQLGG